MKNAKIFGADVWSSLARTPAALAMGRFMRSAETVCTRRHPTEAHVRPNGRPMGAQTGAFAGPEYGRKRTTPGAVAPGLARILLRRTSLSKSARLPAHAQSSRPNPATGSKQ
jgi:hypothetical protein